MFASRGARVLLQEYFGLEPNACRPPHTLPKCWEGWPEEALFPKGKEHWLRVSVIDRGRKGTRYVLLQEMKSESAILTHQEMTILHWLRMGKSNPQIAQILRLEVATVKKHLEHIFAKLGVENRTAAASYADALFGTEGPGASAPRPAPPSR